MRDIHVAPQTATVGGKVGYRVVQRYVAVAYRSLHPHPSKALVWQYWASGATPRSLQT